MLDRSDGQIDIDEFSHALAEHGELGSAAMAKEKAQAALR